MIEAQVDVARQDGEVAWSRIEDRDAVDARRDPRYPPPGCHPCPGCIGRHHAQ